MPKKSSRPQKGRVATPGDGALQRDVLAGLRYKLHPSRIGLSGQMRALVDFIIGEQFTTPWLAGITVTSDGYVIIYPKNKNGLLHDQFLGDTDDLYRNYANLLRAVKADAQEAEMFYELYSKKVDDYLGSFKNCIADLLGAQTSETSEIKKRITKLKKIRPDENSAPNEVATAQAEIARLENELRKLSEKTKK